jgi:hypothetical protein
VTLRLFMVTTVIFAFVGIPSAAKEMAFDIIYQNQTNIVVADGEITANTPEVFRQFLATEPFDGFSILIDLNSAGGDLNAGMQLGRLIRQEGLTARVFAYEPRKRNEQYWDPVERLGACLSACALAFLGGERRELDRDAVFGFHYLNSIGDQLGRVTEVRGAMDAETMLMQIDTYIEDMGIAKILNKKIMAKSRDVMFMPSLTDIIDMKIVSANE